MAEKQEQQAVDVPSEATPIGPGDPVEVEAGSQMGDTFAERKAAREGKPFKKSKPEERPATTFADRAKAVRPEDAEDKSVGRSQATRKAAQKTVK